MELTKLTYNRERKYYEKLRTERISDNTWWRVKRNLKVMSLEVTKENLLIYHNLHLLTKGRVSSITSFCAELRDHKAVIQAKAYYSGNDFKAYLKYAGLFPGVNSTFTRWFYDLGGFNKNVLYKTSDLSFILMKALMYKSQKQQGI